MSSADKPGGESKPIRKNARWWLKFGVSTAILALIFTKVDLQAFFKIISGAKPGWLAAVLLLQLAEQNAVAFSWRAMLQAGDFAVPYLQMLRIILVSNFLGFAIPSSMGSDVVKVVGLARYISNTKEALSSLLVFRAMGYAMLFLIAIVSSIVFHSRLPDKPVIGALALALSAGIIIGVAGVVFAKPAMRVSSRLFAMVNASRFHEKLMELHSAFLSYLSMGSAMASAAAGSLAIQLNRILCVYLLSIALGLSADFPAFLVFIPVISALMLVPVSISGIGVREGGYVFFFAYAGLSASEALSLSLLSFALDFSFVLVGGVIYSLIGFPNPEGLAKLVKDGEDAGQIN